jgi:hypothetical protein
MAGSVMVVVVAQATPAVLAEMAITGRSPVVVAAAAVLPSTGSPPVQAATAAMELSA